MTSASQISHEDRSSLSAPEEVKVTHLDWKIAVDFTASVLKGTATYAIRKVSQEATQLKLDTANLIVHKVSDQADNTLAYQENVSDKAHLGTQLVVDLHEDTAKVSIHYETTKDSSALQWLPPAQTVGKVHPYLFTQCQAIHARSLVPCQDRPGVKMTYTAMVTVPSWASCVLSAVLQNSAGSTTDNDARVFVWEQKIPISSYLLAMAVGDLTSREISSRCAVWSEPALIDAVAYEFAYVCLQAALTLMRYLYQECILTVMTFCAFPFPLFIFYCFCTAKPKTFYKLLKI
jgi:leukotriene-A4 hydrolase